MIYLAGPIDQAPHGGRSHLSILRRNVRSVLGELGVAVYDPSTSFVAANKNPVAMHRINEAAIRECGALLALLPVGVATIGTPMEVQTAHALGKPVAVVSGARSVQLQAMGVPVFPETEEGAVTAGEWALGAIENLGGPHGGVVRWTGHGVTPERHHEGDAGFDLTASRTVIVEPGQFHDIPTEIAIQLPPGTWGWITGRSSAWRKRGLHVTNGIIDQGYRGELFFGVHNPGRRPVTVHRGDRLAQLIPLPVVADQVSFLKVDSLEESARGTRGFGSTGGFSER